MWVFSDGIGLEVSALFVKVRFALAPEIPQTKKHKQKKWIRAAAKQHVVYFSICIYKWPTGQRNSAFAQNARPRPLLSANWAIELCIRVARVYARIGKHA